MEDHGQAYTEALEKGDDDDEYDGEDDDKDDGCCHDEVPYTDLEVYNYTKDEDEGLADDVHLVGE